MGKWNLDILYTGFDTEEYSNDYKRLEEVIPALSDLADKCKDMCCESKKKGNFGTANSFCKLKPVLV